MSYPNTIDSFVNPVGTNTLNSPDHAGAHTSLNTQLIAVENVVGTTLGTNVLKAFAAGDIPARINTSNVLQQPLTGTFTANNSTLGTPAVTGGTINNAIIGTPAVTGGTYDNGVFGTPTLQSPIINVSSDAQGDVYYRSAGGTIARLAPGASGQFLKTQGAAANPVWATGAAGVVLQVIATTFSTAGSTASSSFASTGLAGTITPSSATNKVLVHFTLDMSSNEISTGGAYAIFRGTTNVYQPISNAGLGLANLRQLLSGVYLDSPASATPGTYTIQFKVNTGSGTVFAQVDSTTSSLVLEEIAA